MDTDDKQNPDRDDDDSITGAGVPMPGQTDSPLSDADAGTADAKAEPGEEYTGD